jgi:hypothetical protein
MNLRQQSHIHYIYLQIIDGIPNDVEVLKYIFPIYGALKDCKILNTMYNSKLYSLKK